MSQIAVEQILGRLLTDPGFRRQFFADPPRVTLLAGLRLSSEELDALQRLPQAEIVALSRQIDDRICRLCCAEEDSANSRPAPGSPPA